MRVAELGCRRVAVWGLGREGRAAVGFLRKRHPRLPLVMLDDADGQPEELGGAIDYAFGADAIARALEDVEVIIKSPGVSLYRPEIRTALGKGVHVTSLLNLWFAENYDLKTICVTGTKGKSTTASLIAYILTQLGRRSALAGNIGVAITEIDDASAEFAVIEVSSYQAADFDGVCDVALLSSLYPEHIDWHLSVDNYFGDKINLLKHCKYQVVDRDVATTVDRFISPSWAQALFFNGTSDIHSSGTQICDGRRVVGKIRNPYLERPHNRSNLCAALAVLKIFGIDVAAALTAAEGFRGLPHRQQELGEIDGVLFVDDSIATIPEATIAALAVYCGRDIAVILGGHDRGIDYTRLIDTVLAGAAKAVICLGASGQRIYALAQATADRRQPAACALHCARSMAEAVAFAQRVTPPGGVVLLSPAAPSYGQYRNYIERGRDFAVKAGFPASPQIGSHSSLE